MSRFCAILIILSFWLALTPSPSVRAQSVRTLPSSHLDFGIASSPSDLAWMSGTPWKYRYQYLSGGVNTPNGWTTWQDTSLPPGQFVLDYLSNSSQVNSIPVFTWYQLLQSTPSVGTDEASRDLSNLNNASTMNSYYASFVLLLQRAGTTSSPVIIHVEPDFWGYMQQKSNNASASTVSASVASANYSCPSPGVGTCLSAFPNTVQGFAYSLIHLRDIYASNSCLALVEQH